MTSGERTTRRARYGGLIATALLLAAAAKADGPAVPPLPSPPPAKAPDPEAGRRYLLHGDYVGAGIPLALWKQANGNRPAENRRLMRDRVDPTVPDELNQYTRPSGAEVVGGLNCLGCHASHFRGEMVIGMGNSLKDFGSGASTTSYTPLRLLGAVLYKDGSPERETLREFLRGAQILDGKAGVPTRGLNPAFRFEEIAAAHRNPADLSWRTVPGFAYSPKPEPGHWSDVPPWWGVRKKTALYYNGMGRGDPARLIGQIGVVMISDASDAERTLPGMRDVLAYIKTLRPPKHPGPIDEPLSLRGADLFAAKCADCHGTYGERETYPNKLIPVDKVGTDPHYARRLLDSGLNAWFNQSWFAKGDKGAAEAAAYAMPTLAYVAPPLDGVWATAPYFHNGSVPTLDAVLNSKSRPTRWTRTFDEHDYNLSPPGWNFTAAPDDFVGPPSRRDYDSALPGCGNQGHTYGDDLTDAERAAVIEYLKTL